MGDDAISEPHPGSKNSANAPKVSEEPTITHQESNASQSWLKWNWNLAKSKEGDTAMALFNDPNDLHEDVSPAEVRKLIWKIDFMILPYLAVCYAFFYIDKVSGKSFRH
jgi:hypothetical protein